MFFIAFGASYLDYMGHFIWLNAIINMIVRIIPKKSICLLLAKPKGINPKKPPMKKFDSVFSEAVRDPAMIRAIPIKRTMNPWLIRDVIFS